MKLLKHELRGVEMNLKKYNHSDIRKIDSNEIVEITSLSQGSRVYVYTEFCYGKIIKVFRDTEVALVLLDSDDMPKKYSFTDLKLIFDNKVPENDTICGTDKKLSYPIVDKLSDKNMRVFRNFGDKIPNDFLIGADDTKIDLEKFVRNFFKKL